MRFFSPLVDITEGYFLGLPSRKWNTIICALFGGELESIKLSFTVRTHIKEFFFL